MQLNTVVQVEFHHFGPQIGPSCKSSRVPYNDVTIKYSVNKWFSYSIFTAAEKATIITGIILTVAVIIIIRHIMRLCYCHVTVEGLSAEGGHSTAASSQSQSRLLIHLLIHLDKEGRACSCKRTNPVTLFTFFRVLKWKLCVYEDLLAKFFHSVWSWWASVHMMFTHSYVVSECVRARRARWWFPSSPARRVRTLISSRVGRKTENGFSHFNFTHIFFEANESLKHSQTSGWHLHTQCHPVTVDEILPASVCVCSVGLWTHLDAAWVFSWYLPVLNRFCSCVGLQVFHLSA